MVNLLRKQKFDGALVRRLSFDAMDLEKQEVPPSTTEFDRFTALLPHLPNLNELYISTLPSPIDTAFQESFGSSLSPLHNLVQLTLGTWGERAIGRQGPATFDARNLRHSNPPLLLSVLLSVLPHLPSLRTLGIILQGCSPSQLAPTLPTFLCPATEVNLDIFAPFNSQDLSLLAQSTFPNANLFSVDFAGPGQSLTTPNLVSAFSLLSPHLRSLYHTGFHFPGIYLDTLLPHFPLLRVLTLHSTSVSPTFVPHLPPLLEGIIIDHRFEAVEESPAEPTLLSAFLHERNTNPSFMRNLIERKVFCAKGDEAKLVKVVQTDGGSGTPADEDEEPDAW